MVSHTPRSHPAHGAQALARRAASLPASAVSLHQRVAMTAAAVADAVSVLISWAVDIGQPPAESNCQAPTPGFQKARG